ncbi:uncharacterized protein BYT42DRAFT_556377 [Radiomyces spectabilis]|uniref:uncharacterized protein n=1 Tax=Radiomyces spectabilis TaxID=64574 RepID=UPI00221F3228|nr:uncharacterized protein BYT42DRAFT_556377 [Radiomyces spectabilis]KAI8391296.1 hypothetical protein BYT42DRAFT_556377 [Radiomyces spectabilis]
MSPKLNLTIRDTLPHLNHCYHFQLHICIQCMKTILTNPIMFMVAQTMVVRFSRYHLNRQHNRRRHGIRFTRRLAVQYGKPRPCTPPLLQRNIAIRKILTPTLGIKVCPRIRVWIDQPRSLPMGVDENQHEMKLLKGLREYNNLLTWMDNEFWEQSKE